MKLLKLIISLLLCLLIWPSLIAFAEGTEELNPVKRKLEPGTHIIAAGTGMLENNSGNIMIDLPPGATVVQALLYWEGQSIGDTPSPDQDSILIDLAPAPDTICLIFPFSIYCKVCS